MKTTERRYLIIGGQPKSGTTSLYDWLSVHPDICPSRLKEARFFLDADYPLRSSNRFDGENIEAYGNLFNETEGNSVKVYLEATPDYLYSRSAIRIAELLPQAHIIFILRDPVERMVSWYKFARQRAMLREDISFDAYVAMQTDSSVKPDTPVYMRALEQCRVEKYLPAFREAFGDRCLVIDFAEMGIDPAGVVKRVCAFAGLNPSTYHDFSFTAKNVSMSVASSRHHALYFRTRSFVLYLLNPSPRVVKAVRPFNNLLKKMLFKSSKVASEISVSEKTRSLIVSALAPESGINLVENDR